MTATKTAAIGANTCAGRRMIAAVCRWYCAVSFASQRLRYTFCGFR
ncbi:hypothetical protein Barb4_02462 [Bacteroidales bacterium Barb4]|nr:hypothetical protein Barb4_02462 [Bacteroidales bacterium Barb4]